MLAARAQCGPRGRGDSDLRGGKGVGVAAGVDAERGGAGGAPRRRKESLRLARAESGGRRKARSRCRAARGMRGVARGAACNRFDTGADDRRGI